MRNLDYLRRYRLEIGEDGGAWRIPSCLDKRPLRIIASWGFGWDHISVSRASRPPYWAEMEQVAKLFFAEDETAMQFHVPSRDHINMHPNCLHWWRPQRQDIPLPPSWFV
jgi:hypothetical protein